MSNHEDPEENPERNFDILTLVDINHVYAVVLTDDGGRFVFRVPPDEVKADLNMEM